MGEFRDMGNPAQVVEKNPAQAAIFFFTTRAGFPMSLYLPIQERYSSMQQDLARDAILLLQ
jgi:hypothetical protein